VLLVVQDGEDQNIGLGFLENVKDLVGELFQHGATAVLMEQLKGSRKVLYLFQCFGEAIGEIKTQSFLLAFVLGYSLVVVLNGIVG